MKIKLHQIKAFNAVAEQGSVRSASRTLAISQPAVTKALRELEECLGASLFYRGAKGVMLTHYGEIFFQHSQIVLREIQLAQDDIQQQLGKSAGQVSIGINPNIAISLMPEVMVCFVEEFPQVKICIHEGMAYNNLVQLRQGETDFCINNAYPNVQDNDLSFEKLLEMKFRVLMRKGHPMEKATKLEALARCNWVMPTLRPGYYKQIHDLLVSKGFVPEQTITSDSFLSILSLLDKSDFISIAPESMVKNLAGFYNFSSLDLDPPLPPAVFYLIQRVGSRLPPAASRLAQLFRIQVRPKYESPKTRWQSDCASA